MVSAAAAIAVCLAGSALASWLLTARALRYAQRVSLIDHPGARTSHATPTPRGGGVGMAASVLGSAAILWGLGYIDPRLGMSLIGGGLLVAGIGWIDDHGNVPASIRAAVHLAAGIVLLSAYGWPASINFGSAEIALGVFGRVFYLLLVVWLINMFNFMDGIDGIAASQALVVSVAASVLLMMESQVGLALACVVLAGSSLGLLWWNWPPAKVFMGDVGSGFLGFAVACLAIAGSRSGSISVPVWMLLLSVFLFDATVTLVRRIARGERWYEAHRSHAYQRLVIAGRSHRFVTASSIGLTVLAGILGFIAFRWDALTPMMLVSQIVLLTAVYLWIERVRPMSSRPAAE